MKEIRYINTDLDVWTTRDIRPLVKALTVRGVHCLHPDLAADDYRFAVFETDEQFSEPEETIRTMLSAIESLRGVARGVWKGSTTREFNLGYDCGDRPWSFQNGLSNEVLSRMAAASATFKLTLYPPRPLRRTRSAKKANRS